jgi:polysaccharide export outer membrane protein
MRSDGNCRQIEILVLFAVMAVAWPARCQNGTAPVLASSASSSHDDSHTGTATTELRSVAASQNPSAVADNSNYIIGSDDLLNVHVWHQSEISGPVTVRPDGKISLPLIGEMTASGLTPPQLQNNIADRLRTFVKEPEVTVIVQQANSKRFNVMGRVEHAGSFSLATRMRVLDGIAAAGGFGDFAKTAKVYVLRPTGSNGVQKLPFNYKRITQGHDDSENIELQSGDTVVVP